MMTQHNAYQINTIKCCRMLNSRTYYMAGGGIAVCIMHLFASAHCVIVSHYVSHLSGSLSGASGFYFLRTDFLKPTIQSI